MGHLNGVRQSVFVYGNRCHEIELEKGEVCQVVLGESFMVQVGVNAAEAPKTSPTRSIFFKIWDHNSLVIAHDHMGGPPLAINEKTNLAANFKRKLADSLGKFRGNNKGRWGSATVEILQATDLVCLQSACLSMNLD
jgi:hypothetical protein